MLCESGHPSRCDRLVVRTPTLRPRTRESRIPDEPQIVLIRCPGHKALECVAFGWTTSPNYGRRRWRREQRYRPRHCVRLGYFLKASFTFSPACLRLPFIWSALPSAWSL